MEEVDDHDRCEWVNISSGIGSPGSSQIKGHKMVVVVVLWTHWQHVATAAV